MDIARSQPRSAPTGGRLPASARTSAARAGAITLAQIAAAAAYVAFFAFGDAPSPFSLEDWVFMLVPPAIFAFLFVAGLFGVSSTQIVGWQRLLSGLGSLIAAAGLAVGLVLLPLSLFGSFMDYAIG